MYEAAELLDELDSLDDELLEESPSEELLGSASALEELGMDGIVPPAAKVKPLAVSIFLEKDGTLIVLFVFFLNLRPPNT